MDPVWDNEGIKIRQFAAHLRIIVGQKKTNTRQCQGRCFFDKEEAHLGARGSINYLKRFIGFAVSRFLFSWFSIRCFLGCLVSWFQSFKVAKIEMFHITPCPFHVCWWGLMICPTRKHVTNVSNVWQFSNCNYPKLRQRIRGHGGRLFFIQSHLGGCSKMMRGIGGYHLFLNKDGR